MRPPADCLELFAHVFYHRRRPSRFFERTCAIISCCTGLLNARQPYQQHNRRNKQCVFIVRGCASFTYNSKGVLLFKIACEHFRAIWFIESLIAHYNWFWSSILKLAASGKFNIFDPLDFRDSVNYRPINQVCSECLCFWEKARRWNSIVAHDTYSYRGFAQLLMFL